MPIDQRINGINGPVGQRGTIALRHNRSRIVTPSSSTVQSRLILVEHTMKSGSSAQEEAGNGGGVKVLQPNKSHRYMVIVALFVVYLVIGVCDIIMWIDTQETPRSKDVPVGNDERTMFLVNLVLTGISTFVSLAGFVAAVLTVAYATSKTAKVAFSIMASHCICMVAQGVAFGYLYFLNDKLLPQNFKYILIVAAIAVSDVLLMVQLWKFARKYAEREQAAADANGVSSKFLDGHDAELADA